MLDVKKLTKNPRYSYYNSMPTKELKEELRFYEASRKTDKKTLKEASSSMTYAGKEQLRTAIMRQGGTINLIEGILKGRK